MTAAQLGVLIMLASCLTVGGLILAIALYVAIAAAACAALALLVAALALVLPSAPPSASEGPARSRVMP